MDLAIDWSTLIFELEQLSRLIFIEKLPDYGGLFTSTIILLFLLEIKHQFLQRRTNKKIKQLERLLFELQRK